MEYIDVERNLAMCTSFIQFFFLVYIVGIFIMLYFSYVTTSTKEEVTVDYDYIAATTTIEAEKEIGSIDDMLRVFVVITLALG
jgi:hypothetical protein